MSAAVQEDRGQDFEFAPHGTFDERLATLRKIAGELAEQRPPWTVFHREVLGAEGLVRRLFPSPDAREFYRRSTTRLHVEGMLARLRDKSIDEEGEPTRVITVRLPASLHERLRTEAHDGRTSMNQLCITKLLAELVETSPPCDETKRPARETISPAGETKGAA